MSGGLNIYGMIAGLGDTFTKSYDAAVKTQNDAEAPKVLGDLHAAIAGAAGAPAMTVGTMTQPRGSALPSFADTSGPSGSYVANLFRRESGNNPLAQAPTSSARGLGQFTKDTWNGVARNHPDLGLTPVGGGQDGRIDPDQMLRATKAFTAENEAILGRAGLPVNDATRYSLHFLGAGGGPRFVAGAVNTPDALAISMVRPEQVRANRSIFFGKDGRPKTAGEVLSSFGASFGGGRSQAPTAVASADEANLPVAGGQNAEFQIPPAVSGGRVMTVPSGTGGAPPAAEAPAAAPGASPAPQGFGGVPATRATMTPQLQTALNAAWKNPETRSAATQVFQHLLKGKESQWQLSTMGDQPVLFNQSTAQIVPVGQAKRQTATVGNSIVDLATGQPIYTAPDKDENKLQSVAPGTTLYDPRARAPVFTAPRAEEPEKDEGAKITAQTEARRKAAPGLGLIEGTPAWQSYVGTGKIGRDQDLSATDKKAIQEADEGVLSAQTAIDALKQAKDLSGKSYEGPTAGLRSAVTSMFGNDSGVATQDLSNVVTTNALGQLKAIFGGNPTEGERAILLQIQGSVNQPDVVRQKIFDRGMALAQKRLEFNRARAEDLRGGTYYKQDGAGSQGKAAGIPKGEARVSIPGGKSASSALAEAQSVAKSRPDLKPQLQERLRSWGIDPKRLDD